MRRVEIEPDLESWRAVARGLLAEGVAPGDVLWSDGTAAGQEVIPGLAPPPAGLPTDLARSDPPPGFRVPRKLMDLARRVACHRDPDRWALLYRVLWRLAHGEPHLLEVEVDDDVRRLCLLEKAVRRDAHKMKAFVRFRKVETEDGERFIAWHRSDHRILELVAPFFADRFGDMSWSILTPDGSAHWDAGEGGELRFGPGLPRGAAPDGDRLEDLWRTYYAAIFNPARIKLAHMRAEMPVRHWATLPETRLIPELLRDAPGRVAGMIEHARQPVARDFFPADPTLPALAAAVQGCEACDLCRRATRAVFGEGPAGAAAMLVGEQPGDQEDLSGRPFVGPAGQVLMEALAEVGIAREEVYLTNAVKHFKWEPRGKRRIHRTPTLGEAAACRPWLEEEIAQVRPEVLVCMGGTAARSLFGAEFRITRQRGQVFEGTRWAPWVLATHHPSALLRTEDDTVRERMRRELVADLGLAAERLAYLAAG